MQATWTDSKWNNKNDERNSLQAQIKGKKNMYGFSMSDTKEETLWFTNIWNM